MHWFLTKVLIRNNRWIIHGVREEFSILTSQITRTNLYDELALNLNYTEACGLCVISPEEVYRIEVSIQNNVNKWIDRNRLSKVSADENIYFDNEYYMGLPPLAFCYWKGMINTDLN